MPKIFLMNYKVKTIGVFERQAKKLTKKYPSLKTELILLVGDLKENPHQGIPLGKGCYKLRIAIKSKGKGKSGGARVITNLAIEENLVFLLSIYDKSEKNNLSNKELEELLGALRD